MMKEYVLSYVHYLDQLHFPNQTVLIEKKRPSWQAGLLNLPGGHVEPTDQSLKDAALRELREETGLDSCRSQTTHLGKMCGEDWLVHVFRCNVWSDRTITGQYCGVRPEQKTDEDVHLVSAFQAPKLPKLIPNLRVIIPLCHLGVSGWELRFNSSISDQTNGPFERFEVLLPT